MSSNLQIVNKAVIFKSIPVTLFYHLVSLPPVLMFYFFEVQLLKLEQGVGQTANCAEVVVLFAIKLENYAHQTAIEKPSTIRNFRERQRSKCQNYPKYPQCIVGFMQGAQC